MMAIHDVQQIDVTVDTEIGIQRKAEEAEVTPGAHFLADVNQECPRAAVILLDPDSARALPDVHSAIGFEERANSLVPGSAGGAVHSCFGKASRQSGGGRKALA